MPSRLRDNSSRLPAYLRIAQMLRARIAEGGYLSGEFLPPERDLADEFSASRQTIRQAIDLLRQEGLVTPEQGRGTRIVRAQPAESVAPEETESFQLAALVVYGMSREGSAAIFQGCQAVM